MVFSSILFITRFLPLVLAIYFIVPKRIRNLVLFLSSILFYAWGEPVYILLMCFTITVDYVFGIIIDKQVSAGKKNGAKVSLAAAVAINLLLLGFFKYANFTINTVNSLTGAGIAAIKLALPIGISFYTFQSLSYVIDVYRGDTKVQKNILDFGTYVTLFPQLIAGPIVRYRTVAEEMKGRVENRADFARGISRFIFGMGKKVLLANNAGLLWDSVNALTAAEMSVGSFWLGILAYTFQIYFDFSGYSDMAIGMGPMFGFHFDENFNYPYMAKSITEFWRRWHISLSTWFKEYVYIPLGGNRAGIGKQIRNIIIVWMLTGFWHGASWNFVLWGLFYLPFIVVENWWKKKELPVLPRFFRHILAIFILNFGWLLFRYSDINQLFDVISIYLGIRNNGFTVSTVNINIQNNIFLLIVCVLACTPLFYVIDKKLTEKSEEGSVNVGVLHSIKILICIALLGLSLIAMAGNSFTPFLYNQF